MTPPPPHTHTPLHLSGCWFGVGVGLSYQVGLGAHTPTPGKVRDPIVDSSNSTCNFSCWIGSGQDSFLLISHYIGTCEDHHFKFERYQSRDTNSAIRSIQSQDYLYFLHNHIHPLPFVEWVTNYWASNGAAYISDKSLNLIATHVMLMSVLYLTALRRCHLRLKQNLGVQPPRLTKVTT